MYNDESDPNDCEFWADGEETEWSDDVEVGYALFWRSSGEIVSVHHDESAAVAFAKQATISRDSVIKPVPLFPEPDDIEYPNLP